MKRKCMKRLFVFVAAVLLAAGEPVFAQSGAQPCPLSASSYVVLQSSLEYTNVSPFYAQSVYNCVREIVSGFLAARIGMDNFFFDKGQKAGSEDQSWEGSLDLRCEVKRVSNDVVVSVRIDVHETGQNLLSLEDSAPFFQPSVALHSFALAFPGSFSGQVVREYSFPVYPRGFLQPSLSLGNVVNYDSLWTLGDLEQDMRVTPGVPENVLQDVRNYRVKTGFEVAAVVLGSAAFFGTLIPIAITGGYSTVENEPILKTPENVPPWLWITCGAGLLTMLLVPIEVAIFPSDLGTTLNKWCRD